MVEVRISRQNVEVLADPGAVASISRVDTQVATQATEASSGEVRVSRLVVEVLAKAPEVAGVTRFDTQVATQATEASSGEVRISRLAVEVLASPIREASVTRFDTEVATVASEAGTGESALISRQSLEALARRGSADPVVPLALAAGIDIFLHNWATSLRLNTSYLTDISESASTGAEARMGLILKPDRSMRVVWESDDTSRLDRMYVAMRKLSNERLNVPLYCDQREVQLAYLSGDDTVFVDTSRGRWSLGARVVIVQLDFCNQYVSHSFHIISDLEDDRLVFDAALGTAVASGSYIMPMMDMEVVLNPELEMATALVNKLTVEFIEVQGNSALPSVKADFPTNAQFFEDRPIFDVPADWITGLKKGRQRQGRAYNQGRGRVVYTAGDRSRQTHEIDMTGDRDDMWRAVEFFDTRRGRLRSFWHIDQEFVWDAVDIDPSGNFVSVAILGDLDDFKAELEGGLIGLVMDTGDYHVRRVVTVQEILGVYRCTLSTSLPSGLLANDVVRIARARYTRFGSDEMEEDWEHTGYMQTTLGFIETLEETNVTT